MEQRERRPSDGTVWMMNTGAGLHSPGDEGQQDRACDARVLNNNNRSIVNGRIDYGTYSFACT